MVNTNFTKMIRKSKSNKRSPSTKRRTQKRRTQKGGVGFRPDVATGCKIGGLPVINATSDCPSVGPGDKKFARALYGAGRKQNKKSKSKNRRSNNQRKTKGPKK